MADKYNRTDDDIELDDDDAQKLLADAVDDDDDGDRDDDTREKKGDDDRRRSPKDDDGDDDGDPSKLGDPGKRALDAMKRERNNARKELNDLKAQLKKYQDKDKTETERLAEAREEAATRAAKAEESFRALSIAMDRAPAHASLKHVRMVAKRIRGESEDELEADADELFEMLVPAPKEKEETTRAPRTVAGKPRERLRGGGDPEDEPEESDPRKLADKIRRSRF